MGYYPWGQKESDTTERLHFYFQGRCLLRGGAGGAQSSARALSLSDSRSIFVREGEMPFLLLPHHPLLAGHRWRAHLGSSNNQPCQSGPTLRKCLGPRRGFILHGHVHTQ